MKARGLYPNASNWLRHRVSTYPTRTNKRKGLARLNAGIKDLDIRLHPTRGWKGARKGLARLLAQYRDHDLRSGIRALQRASFRC